MTQASSRRGEIQRGLLSPDGERIALVVTAGDRFAESYVLELGRDTWTRVSPEGGDGGLDDWLPDGKRLLQTRDTADGAQLVVSRIDGAGPVETLTKEEIGFGTAVAPDGRSLLLSRQSAPSQWDIWRLPLEGARRPQPWLVTPHRERASSFSPDGRFVAYWSDDSGRWEVYVRPYSGGGRHQVSTQGGSHPLWSRDGRELFFVSRGRLWTVPVRTSPTFSAGQPQELFAIPDEILLPFRFYDVTPDGQRFLMVQKDPAELRGIELVVVPNWLEEVEAKMAAAR